MIKNILYLHGFASSPTSNKANHILNFLKNKDIKFYVPDLNCGDFTNVTLTKMLNAIIKSISGIEGKFIIVGSSLGGYLASLYAENTPKPPEKMLLLAPGFNLYNLFRNWLGDTGIKEWELNGFFNFMHYSYKRELPLSYAFYRDLEIHTDIPVIKNISIHIIHGTEDNVVPPSITKKFIKKNPEATVEFVKDTHELPNSIQLILRRIKEMIA